MPGEGIGREYGQIDTRPFPFRDKTGIAFEEANRLLRQIWDRIDALEGRRGNVAHGDDIDLNDHRLINVASPEVDTDAINKQYADATYSAPVIVQELQVGGSAPLNVSQLRGTLAQAQPAAIPSVTELPPVISAAPGQLAYFGSAVYYLDNSSDPAVWREIGSSSTRTLEDAATNATSPVFTLVHTSTGTVAAGFGSALMYQLEDASGNAPEEAGSLDIVWADPTAGSEDADFVVRLKTAGAVIAEKSRLSSLGHFTVTGDLKFKSATNFTGSLEHAIGADRSWTFPDASGTVVLETLAQTLTNKTLTDPVINGTVTTSGLTMPDFTGGVIGLTGGLLTTDVQAIGADLVLSTATSGDVFLNPVGNVKFGTFTALGAEVLVGSILIKDSGGTNRKVGIIA